MTAICKKDLVVLVADKNMEFAIRGLLERPEALGIRPVKAVIYVHPEKDPGCLLRGHDFLRAFHRHYQYGMVLFDREGCGREDRSREELEREVEDRMHQGGWKDRAAAIAMDPELETWVWADSPNVGRILGWGDRAPDLRSWLVENDLLEEGSTKPCRPKEAVEKVLHFVRKPRSSAIYHALARAVGLDAGRDPAFSKLREVLRAWLPIGG